MKKLAVVLVAFVIGATAVALCQDQTDTAKENGNSIKAASLVMLDAVWPENEYTVGVPVPPGTVSWAMIDRTNGHCSVHLTGMSEADYDAYLASLVDAGFVLQRENTEMIEGEDYVAACTIFSDGERSVSISYIPDSLTMYLSQAN